MKVLRSVVFWLHLTAGSVAGLIILIMAVTGALLAFERQINAWADAPAVRQGKAEPLPPMPLDSVLAALKTAGQGEPTQLIIHRESNGPLEAHYGRERTLLLSPSTGEVVGVPSRSTREFFSTVERIHRSLGLGMQNSFARGITGTANLIFLFLLLSGLFLWIPKFWNAAGLKARLLFRRGLQNRAREWNWHNVVGIWSAVPLFFIVVTGVVISYPWAGNLLYTLTGTQAPAGGWRGEGRPRSEPGRRSNDVSSGATLPSRALDDLVLTAKQQVPAWKSITVEVPEAGDRVLNVSVDKSIGGQPEQSSQFVINRRDGHIETIKRFRDNNTGRKLRAWARFVHTGEEFGLAGETIAALACLGAVVLVWTGLSMAIRRAIAAAKRQSDRESQKELQAVS